MDAWLLWFNASFWTWLFDLVPWIQARANETESWANQASQSAATAGLTANALVWNPSTNYALGQNAISPTNFQTYRRRVAGTSATDPVSDATNWAAVAAVPDESITPAKLANGGRELGMRNMLINPRGGDVYQRTVAATADDVYFSDRWYALTQTGTVLPAVLSDPENGHPTGTRITQSQATAQRFGYAQIVEGKNCKDMRGSSVTFTPRVQVSGAQSLRYAILAHTGTEDLVTSDVVNNWTSSTFTAGNFFIAGLEIVAIGSATPVANTWTSLPLIAGIVPSSMNNLITFVWTESAQAQNFTLDYDFNQLEAGIVATPFDRRDYGRELIMCQRYYEIQSAKTFVAYVPGTVDSVLYGSWAVEKRASPTLTLLSATQIDTASAGAAPTKSWIAGLSSGGSANSFVGVTIAAASEL
jgi:hypothetical protein